MNDTSPDTQAAHSPIEAPELLRQEERLLVSTETVTRERVRLEKFIVSEECTITVTVRHEEVQLIREDLDPVIIPTTAEPHGEELPQFMTLSEERVIVTTETIPVERVWLREERVTEQSQITDTLGKEQVHYSPSV